MREHIGNTSRLFDVRQYISTDGRQDAAVNGSPKYPEPEQSFINLFTISFKGI